MGRKELVVQRYFPYFRGKQYELITIRENAAILSNAGFVPIIEPVKQSTSSLERAVHELVLTGGNCIIIANPSYGDYCSTGFPVEHINVNEASVSVGMLLTDTTAIDEIRTFCENYSARDVSLIHNGFENGRELATLLADYPKVHRHVFVDENCGKLYRRNFQGAHITRILLRDGFQKRINRNHPPRELFSDLHITYDEEKMNGFGDFLVVGDDYSESGGPAYAVAIHLTYVDSNRDEAMYIYHFKSDRTDTPTDPAGKFAEALAKLVKEVEQPNSPIFRSRAVNEFVELYKERHFPGLGYVKKLSMQHHIETLADYFSRQ